MMTFYHSDDYSRLWMEQVDRGELFLVFIEVFDNHNVVLVIIMFLHIQVQKLMEDIQLVARRHLNTQTSPTNDITACCYLR